MIASRAIAVRVPHPAAALLAPPARPSPPARQLHRPAPPPRQSVYPSAPPRRSAWPLFPAAIFTLKLMAAALAGATVTLMLVPDARKPAAPRAVDVAASPETTVQAQRRTGHLSRGQPDLMLDREIPINFPRRVQVVRYAPLGARPLAALPTSPPFPGTPRSGANPLEGKQLRYLIGTGSAGAGRDNEVTMVSYSTSAPVRHGISIAYCNLFDEHNSGKYGPYLRTSDTAKQYNEGQIDPRGPGWEKNLREQYERRKRQGFEYIELDNPDAYSIKDVIGAIELAESYGLKVIAKNPGLMKGAVDYVAHRNVYGIIVEKGAGGADGMEALRKKAGKPNLPVWFVAFGSGKGWAGNVASAAKQYRNMGVTYSSAGEYGNAIDILPPT
jgi:hypothetical protein